MPTESQTELSPIERLAALLRSVCEAPGDYIGDTELITALISQGALAKYSSEARSIRACSLNTLKKRADADFEGGFEEFDLYRLAARRRIDEFRASEAKPSKQTRVGLLASVGDLEKIVEGLECDLMVHSDAIEAALSHARRYAREAGPEAEERCRKEQREILSLLGLKGPSRGKGDN